MQPSALTSTASSGISQISQVWQFTWETYRTHSLKTIIFSYGLSQEKIQRRKLGSQMRSFHCPQDVVSYWHGCLIIRKEYCQPGKLTQASVPEYLLARLFDWLPRKWALPSNTPKSPEVGVISFGQRDLPRVTRHCVSIVGQMWSKASTINNKNTPITQRVPRI